MSLAVDQRRIVTLRPGHPDEGGVVYWMRRDQRLADNWALLHARELAGRDRPLAVVFTLAPSFLGATIRQYGFMLRGLENVAADLGRKGIRFCLLVGDPVAEMLRFLKQQPVAALVTDFSPLRPHRAWQEKVLHGSKTPFFEVDAHNIVPCRQASPKQEYAARAFRPKVLKLLPEFLTEFPKLSACTVEWPIRLPDVDFAAARKQLKVDTRVPEIVLKPSGEKAVLRVLRDFLSKRLHDYTSNRNDPTKRAQSYLSPYLHFGQISAQRIAWEVKLQEHNSEAGEVFLEELIVRRELSDNYCFHQPEYDRFDSLPEWGRRTLDEHRHDPREYLYSQAELEHAETHDDLWNAAQLEMVHFGTMPGYLRMYWAKKILEWSPTPEEAFAAAIYLNDRYQFDGRDPNGYVGVAWSIGGLHDRPWQERPVFGKIRYMNYNGCRRKFDVAAYIARVQRAVEDLRK
ncbi:MAG: deoxyribodipyrimidine photo-lyase [bacterium]